MVDAKIPVRRADGIIADLVTKAELREGLSNGSIERCCETIYRPDVRGTARPTPNRYFKKTE